MFKVSVPGSIMLLGEHAVLYGYPAVVCAINRRITIKLQPRKDDLVIIKSAKFGDHETTIEQLFSDVVKDEENNFRFVLAAIKNFHQFINSGFELNITTDFSDQIGLGSSAAVTVATIAVMQKWLQGKIDLNLVYKIGVNTVRLVQGGLGSGADVAASVFGGVVHYRVEPLLVEKLNYIPTVFLVYTGYKTPTANVIKVVQELEKKEPTKYQELYKRIGDLVARGVVCLQQQDWLQLGEIFIDHQNMQRELGVSDVISDEIIKEVLNLPTVFGAKISGSGLGDCIVVLGEVAQDYFPLSEEQRARGIKQIEISIDNHGIIYESD